MEHAAALLHPKMGTPVRKVLTKGAALIPSSKKRGGLGSELDIPLGHKDAAYVRSHFDGMQVSINDAPRADEIMVAVAVTTGGRPLPRVAVRDGGHRRRGAGLSMPASCREATFGLLCRTSVPSLPAKRSNPDCQGRSRDCFASA
jgi:hypothetical protein